MKALLSFTGSSDERVECFNGILREMLEEHATYYAKPAGRRGHYGLNIIGGLSGAYHGFTQPGWSGSHDHVQTKRNEKRWDDLLEKALESLDVLPKPYASAYGWRTSGGNNLLIRWGAHSIKVELSGRRHGIPWWLVERAGYQPNQFRVGRVLTHSPQAMPWETGVESTSEEPTAPDEPFAFQPDDTWLLERLDVDHPAA